LNGEAWKSEVVGQLLLRLSAAIAIVSAIAAMAFVRRYDRKSQPRSSGHGITKSPRILSSSSASVMRVSSSPTSEVTSFAVSTFGIMPDSIGESGRLHSEPGPGSPLIFACFKPAHLRRFQRCRERENMASKIRAHSDQMPIGLFGFGMVLLLLALFGTLTGETVARTGLISRAKDPKGFWLLIATQWVAGAGLMGYLFYKFYGQSN
jgi:hypothetical protein